MSVIISSEKSYAGSWTAHTIGALDLLDGGV
jgi:hypothetical protein